MDLHRIGRRWRWEVNLSSILACAYLGNNYLDSTKSQADDGGAA